MNNSKILNETKKYILNLRKKKYQRIVLSKRKLFLRERAIEYILSLETVSDNKKNICECCLFYTKNLNKKNFLSFYKKFNVNIVLKANYDSKTLIKKTNKKACLYAYCLFSEFLIKNKEVNDLQKLNTILKINDLFILKFKENRDIRLIKYFRNNIYHEKRLLNLYL